jgi:hypothetical protein
MDSFGGALIDLDSFGGALIDLDSSRGAILVVAIRDLSGSAVRR